jgi:hypothetical protein
MIESPNARMQRLNAFPHCLLLSLAFTTPQTEAILLAVASRRRLRPDTPSFYAPFPSHHVTFNVGM